MSSIRLKNRLEQWRIKKKNLSIGKLDNIQIFKNKDLETNWHYSIVRIKILVGVMKELFERSLQCKEKIIGLHQGQEHPPASEFRSFKEKKSGIVAASIVSQNEVLGTLKVGDKFSFDLKRTSMLTTYSIYISFHSFHKRDINSHRNTAINTINQSEIDQPIGPAIAMSNNANILMFLWARCIRITLHIILTTSYKINTNRSEQII